MKKLILVGNKVISSDISQLVNSYDYVVRVNRMNNYGNTGTKIDGYYIGLYNQFRLKYNGGQFKEHFKEAKQVFCAPKTLNSPYLLDYLTEYQASHLEPVDINASRVGIGTLFPTSTISLLWHFVNTEWSNNYSITLTGVDIDGRGEMFRTNMEWLGTCHMHAGDMEEKYIKGLINNGTIDFIAVD